MTKKALVPNDKKDWRYHPDNPFSHRFVSMKHRTEIEKARWWAYLPIRGTQQRAVLDDDRVFRDNDPW